MPLSMPASPGFVRSKFGLETNTQRFESPLNRAVQRIALSGGRWVASYTLPKMTRAQFAAWQAFFLGLQGSYNTFNAYDPDAREPRGAVGGTPLVKGGSQTGSSLLTDGWPNNTTVLRAGDYFSVNGEMKMSTADVLSDGSGNATIPHQPPWRDSPADNAPLTVRDVTCEMILSDDQQAMWNTGAKLGIYDEITFSGIEAFS